MKKNRHSRWRPVSMLITAVATMIGLGAMAAPAGAAAAPVNSKVSSGYAHTCVVQGTAGTLSCWGGNYSGQVGDGTTTSRAAPTRIGDGWASVDGGTSYNCGIKTTGTLWCWGSNTRGQLGDGTTTRRTAPVQVGTATTWASVSAGDSHTCATRTEGTLFCWGFNRFGQLGDGAAVYTATTPLQVGTASTWAGVTAGFAHTCATRTEGTLFCWGDSSTGQLGTGALGYKTTPRRSARRAAGPG